MAAANPIDTIQALAATLGVTDNIAFGAVPDADQTQSSVNASLKGEAIGASILADLTLNRSVISATLATEIKIMI